MGKILGTYLVPHPPIILKEIGKGEERDAQKTIDAMELISREIKDKNPDTIIIITPHGPLFRDAVSISKQSELRGNFSTFGAKNVSFVKNNDINLVDKISKHAAKKNIMCALIDSDMARDYNISTGLDHGTMVPLYFIDKEYSDYNLVHITYGLLSREELYQFGMSIGEAIAETKTDTIILASGDLSHRLKEGAPAGYHPSGKTFDQELIKLIKIGDFLEILNMDTCLGEEAGECGLRSLDIMLGAIDGYHVSTEILSYEGPFGVGYGVVRFDLEMQDKDKKLLNRILQNRSNKINKIRESEDEYVSLARTALEHYVKNGEILTLNCKDDDPLHNSRAGVFVSIKKDGDLRGCIGTIYPTSKSIAEEIVRNAIQAGSSDPRFYPVEEEELDYLTYSVDVLKEPEDIKGVDELDVKRFGVIVSSGKKSGLLLPNLENVQTVEEQIRIALQKAGIDPNENYSIQRFEVIRHK